MENSFQKLGGIAALCEALIYISAFVFFGMFWSYPVDGDSLEKLVFLADNHLVLMIVNLLMYVLFGIILAVLVLALHQRLSVSAPTLSQVASVFGVVWVGLVIASGMVANTGLSTVVELSITDPEQAMTVWRTINAVVEGMGGGNEVVGGLWVLSLSIAAQKGNTLQGALNRFGMFVGVVGILSIYPAEVFTEIFGLSQIVWFVWLGVIMWIKPLSRPN